MLFPEQGISAWLTERRPLLWQLLGERQQELNDGNAVSILLDLLHSPDGLPPKAYQIYRLINRHLHESPLLIWPMLIRAEGWHRCREKMRGQWGGKRSGAGPLCNQPSRRRLLPHVPIHNRTQLAIALTIDPDDLLVGLHIRTWQRML